MKQLFAIVVLGSAFAVPPAFAKDAPKTQKHRKNDAEEKEIKPDKACMKAADKSIAESRDSDGTFEQVEKDGDDVIYVYGVTRGHDDACQYDINVKVHKHSDGTCTADKAEFDGNSANCG